MIYVGGGGWLFDFVYLISMFSSCSTLNRCYIKICSVDSEFEFLLTKLCSLKQKLNHILPSTK